MLRASPKTDARQASVDLRVHFEEESFDLLKDKISLPENESLGKLDMDMRALSEDAQEYETWAGERCDAARRRGG
jgi:hypothetical protein